MAISLKHLNPLTGSYESVYDQQILPIGALRLKAEGVTTTAAQTVQLIYGTASGLSERIFSRSYYPSNQSIELDIREDMAGVLKLANINSPDEEEDLCCIRMTVTVGSSTFHFFASIAEENPSFGPTDIDTADVDSVTELRFSEANPQQGRQEDQDDLGTEEDEIDLYVRTRRGLQFLKTVAFTGFVMQDRLYSRINVADLPVQIGEAFQLMIKAEPYIEGWSSPVYRLQPGHAEQYMFLNKYGVLDVLPMFGDISYAPEYDTENGSYSDENFRLRMDVEDFYRQNTGHLSRRTMAALADLLTSRQIYHKVNGTWQQILIEETDLSLSLRDNLHSCSFRFRYADRTVKPHNLAD